MARTNLFVYGTLKRGCPGHELLAGQTFLGPARTLPRYRLYDCGPYPCLVPDPAAGIAVQGELWAVDAAALARLDEYEGVPGLFVRQPVALDGFAGPVQAYLYQGSCSSFTDCGAVWLPGVSA